jgi:nuclear pore complex protein Nup155
MYADPGDYYDICLLIFESANHRNQADIEATWNYYITAIHAKAQNNEIDVNAPYEAIVNMMIDMSQRLKNSDTTFSPNLLIPLIENYAVEYQNGIGPRAWVPDLFIHVGFPHESILSVLQNSYLAEVAPFVGANKRILAYHMVYVCDKWYQDCIRSNKRLFGTEENATGISQLLEALVQTGDLRTPADTDFANTLRGKIDRSLR